MHLGHHCRASTQFGAYKHLKDALMKLITKRDRIIDGIRNFRSVWGDGSYPADKRGIAVGAELAKLDVDSVSYEKVEALMGNCAWTRLVCDECSSDVYAVVEIGQDVLEIGHDPSGTAQICVSCIKKAASLSAC